MATKQPVGILAYGSLIGHPGQEIEEVCTSRLVGVMTPFPVEFARSSAKRGGAPTLVPHDDGGPVRANVLVLRTSVDDATDRLYRREIDAVGSGLRYKHSDDPGPKRVVINRLERTFGLDVVLYTKLAATIDNLTAATLARLAIDSVWRTDEGRDGISYLMNAMNEGIETPLTHAYAAEIKRLMGARDLAEALAKARTAETHARQD